MASAVAWLAARVGWPLPGSVCEGEMTWSLPPADTETAPMFTAPATPLATLRADASDASGQAAGAAQWLGRAAVATAGDHRHRGIPAPLRHSATAMFTPAMAGSQQGTIICVVGALPPTQQQPRWPRWAVVAPAVVGGRATEDRHPPPRSPHPRRQRHKHPRASHPPPPPCPPQSACCPSPLLTRRHPPTEPPTPRYPRSSPGWRRWGQPRRRQTVGR